MAQNIPGVEAYGSPMVDIGAHFTAGVNAGSGIRANINKKEDMANRALQDEKDNAYRDAEAKRRAELEAARFKQHQLEETHKLEQNFGPDLVRTEDGGIDVQGSAMMQLTRKQRELQEEALGFDEGLNRRNNPDADSSLRDGVAYGQGFNKGQLGAFQQDQLTIRQGEANRVRAEEGRLNREQKTEAAKLKAGGAGAGEEGKTVEQDLNGIKVPGVMNKGRFTPLSGSALEEYEKKKRRASAATTGTNAGHNVRATFDRDGNRIK